MHAESVTVPLVGLATSIVIIHRTAPEVVSDMEATPVPALLDFRGIFDPSYEALRQSIEKLLSTCQELPHPSFSSCRPLERGKW